MLCPGCQYPHSEVVYTKHNHNLNMTERRRQCLRCGKRYTTHEKEREPKNPHDDRFPTGNKT